MCSTFTSKSGSKLYKKNLMLGQVIIKLFPGSSRCFRQRWNVGFTFGVWIGTRDRLWRSLSSQRFRQQQIACWIDSYPFGGPERIHWTSPVFGDCSRCHDWRPNFGIKEKILISNLQIIWKDLTFDLFFVAEGNGTSIGSRCRSIGCM